MLKNVMEYRAIRIFGDGACLYRCIALCFSDIPLINCQRNLHGLPLYSIYLEREAQLSALIRKGTCEILQCHIDVFEIVPDVIQKHILEIDPNNSYATLSDRIKDNEKPGTYAGYLEFLSNLPQLATNKILCLEWQFLTTHSFYLSCLTFNNSPIQKSVSHFDMVRPTI